MRYELINLYLMVILWVLFIYVMIVMIVKMVDDKRKIMFNVGGDCSVYF